MHLDVRRLVVHHRPVSQYGARRLAEILNPRVLSDLYRLDSGVVERFVTTVDNLPADAMNERIRPFRAVPGSLLTEEDLLSAENFARYDPYVGRFLAADPDTLISSYARFYPLFQQAYEELGYPNRYFNDRLVEVIDHLLETPQPDYPLELARPHVLYEYADADLQALSVGQKALLRMGPEHAQAVKQHLRELRNRLVSL